MSGSIYCLMHDHLMSRLQAAGGPLSASIGEAGRALGLSRNAVGVLADVVEGFFTIARDRRSVFHGTGDGRRRAAPPPPPPPPRVTVPDHYATLGVKPMADVAAIRKAYRKLALKHHPDRGGEAAVFAAVSGAYKILRDPESRRLYDAQRMMG